ncbi:MAG: glycosyltransferase [Actinomycetota bacterium]
MNTPEPKQSVFAIVGMHRSGTSLTASLLQKLGVDIGERLVGPAYGNIKGHFENIDFVEFHKAVLRSQGIDELGCTLQEVSIEGEFVEQAKQIISQNQRNCLWGWKDPRTTLFLNFWINLLPTVNFICVYRSPWEVVDSLYRRATDGSLLNSPEMAVKMWIHYNQEFLSFYQKFPERCLLTNVYAVGNKSQDFIEALNEKFQVELAAPPPDNFEESLLVSEIINTHRPSLIDHYFPEALELYRELEVKAAHLSGASPASSGALIIPPPTPRGVFKDWLEIRKLEKQQKLLKSELKQWQTEFQNAQEKVLGLEAELGETQNKLEGKETQFQAGLAKILNLEAELGLTQSKLDGKEAQFQTALAKTLNLETELGQTQAQLDGREAQFQEAVAKLLALETELGQTQAQLDGREAQFQEAVTKLLALETELGQTQGQLESAVTHQLELQAQYQNAVAKQRELEAVLGQTQSELERSRGEAEQARDEIAAMQSSKFWQLRTKWFSLKQRLRNLRRRFIFSLDTPTRWEILGEDLHIAGWCLHTSQIKLQSARIRSGNTTFEGVYGIERGDVAQTFPQIATAEKSGFRIEAKLPAGRHEVQLEVQDAQGKWHSLASYPVVVSTIQATFDEPVVWEHRQDHVFFAGWCCHPEKKVTKLTLCCGDLTINCAYGLRRKDVGEVFPDWVNSSQSGFEALVDLPPGEWQISLKAELETGEILSFQAPKILKVQRYTLWQKAADKSQELTRFSAAIRKRMAERKQRLGRIIPMPWEIAKVTRQILLIYQQQQKLSSSSGLQPPPGFVVPEPIDPYDAWLEVNQWSDRARDYLIARLAACQGHLPKISVVMPVYNPPTEFLEKAITSVINQVYQNWELCIADDCSPNPAVAEFLKKWAAQDSRIHLSFRSKNGNISAATNSAAELATGEFILFMDNDDELTPDALGEVALYLATHPETDFLYSDDDKIDTEGHRFSPQFKPDWSPELLLSYMYLGHICAVRREIFDKIGGLRLGFEGSQDYDFALRATEVARHVAHLPLILYHWRTAPGSTAISGAAKPASFAAGQKAIQDSLNRRGISGKVFQPDWAVRENLGIFSQVFPNTGPLVTIIIPTKNQLKLLKGCLDSLHKTTYQNYQVVVIDNESDDPQTLDYLKHISHQVLCIKNEGGRFSFAAINNRAVEEVESDYILFLNNDTEVINPQWLSQMVGFAQVPGVGAVGARLLYPDHRIQHAGVIHGLHHGLAGHAFKLMPSENRGYLSQAMVTKNYSAVTAACLLTPRQLFLELGGFDEENFAVAYNDVDYCYRLLEIGYRSVYCPEAELLHREGTSRGFTDNPKEVAAYRRKYAEKSDSFYSPHLSLEDEYFRIQPRRVFVKEGLEASTQILSQNKVLMCSNSLDFTGAPLHQYEIAVQLAKQAIIEPVIFCVTDGPLREVYEQQGIQVIVRDHPLEHIYHRDAYDLALQEFAKEIESYEFDSIYVNTLENFFMVDVAHQIGISSVWNIHESEAWQTYFDRFGPEIAARALECFRFPYRVIFVADATRDRYLPLNSHHNFTVIHNGLDLSRLERLGNAEQARKNLGVEAGEIVLLLLGTVCDRKGQKDLVNALVQLPEKWQGRLRCFIVGDRPSLYSNQLATLVNELPEGLRGRVTLVPETPETAKYYQAADIFVCTSRVESFPRVILEAMAYDLPIITTPVFGIKEQVRPGINGLFYTPEKPEELAEAIRLLLEDETLRQRLAENAKYVLQSLNTFEEMTQAYSQIFQEAAFTAKR